MRLRMRRAAVVTRNRRRSRRGVDMSKEKRKEVFEVEADQMAWLEDMARQYHLPGASKALRVLLDYAMEDGDKAAIFQTIRCRHC